MARAKRTAARKTRIAKPPAPPRRKPQAGEHVRHLAPPPAVRSYMREIIATKNATSEAGQGLSTATRRAAEQGINVPMVRIMARLYSKALQDPAKARVNWEDLKYYLEECTDFSRIAPEGMFTPEEGGQQPLEEEPVAEPPPETTEEPGEQPTIQ